MIFRDLFLESASSFCEAHDRTGIVSAGRNGPHQQQETPLRNTSHWIVTLARAFSLTGNGRFRTKAIELGSALTQGTFRPLGYAYHARMEPNVDRCNGLIGQAWVLEALAALHALTGDRCYQVLGIELANQHRFNPSFGLWYSFDIDGTVLNIDNVFNHQLWFAAAAALVNGHADPALDGKIAAFMNNIPNNMSVSEDGLIQHLIARVLRSPSARLAGVMKHLRQGTLFHRLSRFAHVDKPSSAGFGSHARDNGYHAFNTYAFALLRPAFPDHAIWRSSLLRAAVNYLLTPGYRQALEHSAYGFPYNPPGFEVSFSLQVLLDEPPEPLIPLAQRWVQAQMEHSYNPATRMMGRCVMDKPTQAARLYESARFSDALMNGIHIDMRVVCSGTGSTP